MDGGQGGGQGLGQPGLRPRHPGQIEFVAVENTKSLLQIISFEISIILVRNKVYILRILFLFFKPNCIDKQDSEER